jgi:hypothetical protein
MGVWTFGCHYQVPTRVWLFGYVLRSNVWHDYHVVRVHLFTAYLAFQPVSGFCLSFVEDSEWKAARPQVQLITVLLVGVRVGLNISPQDLTRTSMALGILPICAESLAISTYAMNALNMKFIPAAMLGFVMAAVGDGLVMPLLEVLLETRPPVSSSSSLCIFLTRSSDIYIYIYIYIFCICRSRRRLNH